MIRVLVVGAGGFVGAVLRYGIQHATTRVFPASLLPYGTLIANLLGCITIGWLAGRYEMHAGLGPEMRLFLIAGVVGSLTTFSNLSYESFVLHAEGGSLRAILNIALHIVLGLLAVMFAYNAGSRVGF